jgi:hypothetical protein
MGEIAVTDVLQTAATWLAKQRDANTTQMIVYRRAAQYIIISATFGQSLLKLTDGHGGVKIERTERDLIVTATELDFGAGPVQPQRGDFADWTNPAGQTLRYEVMAPPNEPEYRRADPWGVTLRIHLKFKAAL